MENAVVIKNADKAYKEKMVLKNININVSEGSILGLRGRNGSGKTILLKSILGLIPLTNGEIYVNGKRIGKDVDFAPDTGAMIETPELFKLCTGYNYLYSLSKIRKKKGKDEIKDVLKRVGLYDDRNKLIGKYSLGMKQRLSFAQAIMENPKLLILDEPMNGLDKIWVENMRLYLLELKKQGVTVILTSHYEEDLNNLCDRIITIENGEIIDEEQSN